MASGVRVHEDCKTRFDELKLKHAYKYVIYRLSQDNKVIEVDCVGDKNETYKDFIEKLKAAESAGQGRYAVYDCDYDPEKPQNTKLVFIMWNPDSSPIKSKMVISSSKQYLLKKFEGIEQFVVQANDLSDISWEEMQKCCKKFDKQ